MAETPLTIVNAALARLGVTAISSLTCTTESAAVTMNALYERRVRAQLNGNRWNFTQIRATLTGWALCNPIWGYSCAFLLPSNYVQVEETDIDEETSWRVEEHYCAHNQTCTRVLVTDSCSANIVYTADVWDDPEKWSPLFREAMVIDLAHTAAYPITRNANLKTELREEAEGAWRLARSRDGQEGKTLKRWASNVLTRARFGGLTQRGPWFTDEQR